MKSHLISQVVLKQFASDQRQIIVHTKDSRKTELKPIDCVAYVDVEEVLIGKLEEKWSNEVEDQAERSINTLSSSNVNHTEKHLDAIKKLLALHFVRSKVFQLVEVNHQIIDNDLAKARNETIAIFPEYKEIITEKYGEIIETAYDDIAIKIMEEYIPKVEAYIGDPDIKFEIGEAPDGSEFILGDMPVITADRNGNFGIPITEATSIAMPLTPKYIVSLKKNPDTKKYRKLTAEEVATANRHQLGLMHQHYYSVL
jgi:hypothetical protein